MSEINFDISSEFKNATETYLKEIIEDCKEIINRHIISDIYNAYDPVQYNRTNQMRNINNIDYKMLDDGSIFIYINTDNMEYYSAVDGRNVTELVPWMLEQTGHMDGTGIHNMYHYYPERHYLSNALFEMQGKYPDIKFELRLEEPSVI